MKNDSILMSMQCNQHVWFVVKPHRDSQAKKSPILIMISNHIIYEATIKST